MKYTPEQRLDIGRKIYTGEISKQDAMKQYEIQLSTADLYIIEYKRANGIAIRPRTPSPVVKNISDADLEAYQAMTKEELIRELILSKANELRAKKGYEVKGVGPNKEFVSLSNKSSK